MKAIPILKYDPLTKFSYWIFILFFFILYLFPSPSQSLYEIQENETILYGSDFPVNFGK